MYRVIRNTVGKFGLLACVIIAAVSSASAATVLIDDFSQPNPAAFYVVSALNPDPFLHKTTGAGILGGQRDLLIDVQGTPGLTTAVGSIGGGNFDFGSAGPVTAFLQYDGTDLDVVGPPAALTDGGALGADLTGGGTNNQLRFSFTSVDGGIIVNPLSVAVNLSGPGGTASFTGTIPESVSPQAYSIPFASFATTGSFSFGTVSSLLIALNPVPAASNVDFQLTRIETVPEPGTLVLCALGLVGLFAWRRRR
jgi:hypothetical protein